MCGLYGYVGGMDAITLARMMHAMENRGTDAHGWGYIDGRGRMRAYRGLGPATGMLRRPPERARALLGHTRLATSGTSTVRGAHPFTIHANGEVWLGAHNGSCKGYAEYIAEMRTRRGTRGWEDARDALASSAEELEIHGARVSTDVDSEVLLAAAVLAVQDPDLGALDGLDWHGAYTLLSPTGDVYAGRSIGGTLFATPDGSRWLSTQGYGCDVAVPSTPGPMLLSALMEHARSSTSEVSSGTR